MASDPIQDDLTPDRSGDLGTSSERTDPSEGIEGTGTSASSRGSTSGATATHPGEEIPEVHPVEPGVPVGELDENPAEVPSHVSDPARNPGHSHG
ncbi:MAG: hypothetical protein ACXWDI_06885 [Nocardioides sp.]